MSRGPKTKQAQLSMLNLIQCAPVAIMLHEALVRAHKRNKQRLRFAAADLDLLAWGRDFLPKHFSRPPSAMHRWLAKQLDAARKSRGTKLNVLGPRGSAKSTVATLALPLREAITGGERYVLIVSDTKQQACAHLENIKAELLENSMLARHFPEAAGRGPVWRSSMITLNNGCTIEAVGSGQRIRGRRRRENRPTLIICDDLQNDAHVISAVQREHSRAWFHGMLMKIGAPEANFLNLATALHRDAIALELARAPGWISKTFRAITKWPKNTSLWQQWEAVYTDISKRNYKAAALNFYEQHREQMDAGAAVLWPEVEGLYSLMCMRVESGRTAFEREKQNSPVNPDICEWPETYFNESIWFEQWPANLAVKTMALDPSKGADSRRGDYSALVMLGVDREGMIYVEADLQRCPTSEIAAQAAERFKGFGPDAFGVEANQFQELLGGLFEIEFRRQGILAGKPISIENRVPKQVRIRRLGPYLASHRLRFRANSPSTRLLVDQLVEFPIADYDDGPDALEMAIRLAGEVLQGRTASDGLGHRLPIGLE